MSKKPQCNRWIRFLKETVQTTEAIKQLQEFAGLCLTKETRLARALLLIGAGANGKSVFIKILQWIVGPKHCTTFEADELDDLFSRADLADKLIATSYGADFTRIPTQWLKTIISGDPIQAALKSRGYFDFEPYCKLIFVTNESPVIPTEEDGLFRRVLPVVFKRQFLDNDPDRDPNLLAHLEQELEGIFEWAKEGLHRLGVNSGFTSNPEALDVIRRSPRPVNPVTDFIRHFCRASSIPTIKALRFEMYEGFRQYCEIHGVQTPSRHNFFHELENAIG